MKVVTVLLRIWVVRESKREGAASRTKASSAFHLVHKTCWCIGYCAEQCRISPLHITGSIIAHCKVASLAPICKLRIKWSDTRKMDTLLRTSLDSPSALEKEKKKKKKKRGDSWKSSSREDSAFKVPTVFMGMTNTGRSFDCTGCILEYCCVVTTRGQSSQCRF